MFLNSKITHLLTALESKQLLRQRKIRANIRMHFDSNDYLSLSAHPLVTQGYQRAFAQFAAGSCGSMMISGYHPAHQDLERRFAEVLSVDECMLFSSGYAANLAVAFLLGRLKASAVIDKELHASWYDGLSLAEVQYHRYVHNDSEDLCKKISSKTTGAVITEGIFSMSGQKAPLEKISSYCQSYYHDLFVDEAHSFGVMGTNGLGAIYSEGLNQNQVPLRIIPLGKAMAGQGAIIAGQSNWIEALQQVGRPIIYSTAFSPAYSYGLLQTLDVLLNADERRARIHELIALFRSLVQSSPLDWSDSNTAIQQLRLGCPKKALDYSQKLAARGIHCSALRQPTVSKKNTGLRIVLNYNHTEQDLKQLFEELRLLDGTAT